MTPLTQAERFELDQLESIEDDCRDREEPMPRRHRRRLTALRQRMGATIAQAAVTAIDMYKEDAR